MGAAVSKAFIEYLESVVTPENILLEEPMHKHTTFRVGGPAEVFVTVDNKEQLEKIIKYLNLVERPYFILGNGSNLLVSDKGYRGAVIQMYRNMNKIETEGTVIRAQAGALLSAVAAEAKNHSLTGFEFAGGIPGTLGGAVTMNAGAYGGEMKDVLKTVTVADREGDIIKLSADELNLGYRTSIVKTADYLVLEAEISLKEGNPEEIKELMRDLTERRTSKQPLEFPSAGSTFKRPEGYFAGKLIMDSGLRGYRVGGAQVSEKHCGFVINAGGATAADVRALIQDVQNTVYEKFGVMLEPEVRFLGDFS